MILYVLPEGPPPPDFRSETLGVIIEADHPHLDAWDAVSHSGNRYTYRGETNDTLKICGRILQAARDPLTMVIPASEDAVLACGLACSGQHLRGPSLSQALTCTDRRRQRETFGPMDLNPMWAVNTVPRCDWPMVVKAPVSVQSLGVRYVETHWGYLNALSSLQESKGLQYELERLQHVAPPLYNHIVEEYIPGAQWEISGYQAGYRWRTFEPLRQEWDQPCGKVKSYCADVPQDFRDALNRLARLVTAELGLKWGPFCIEFKGDDPDKLRLVEAHVRLGYEPGNSTYDTMVDPDHQVRALLDGLWG